MRRIYEYQWVRKEIKETHLMEKLNSKDFTAEF
jgi:hypothetical protein